MYDYWAIVRDVHDGDTIMVDIDEGFNDWKHKQSLRIGYISALETWMPGGPESTENLKHVLPVGTKVMIRSVKVDHDPVDDMSFSRYVINVTMPDGSDLGHTLITTGWAVYWDGKTKPVPYPTWPRIVS